MPDKVFLDTNIVVYLYTNDEQAKRDAAFSLIQKFDCVVSTQVLSELTNTLHRKFNLDYESIEQVIAEIEAACLVTPVLSETIHHALQIAKRYGYSYYDSLIVAAALGTNCKSLATEDLQNGQIIESSLKISNPFTNS
jgi:predicted nucleic acid-binding protein